MKKNIKDDLINIYKNSFINTFEAGGGHGFRYYHGLRVMSYCENFLKLSFFKKKNINKDAVIIASLFADIGKINAVNKAGELVYGSKGDLNHAATGSKLIRELLGDKILNDHLIDLVSDIINEQHNSSQTSLESRLVKDADRFDNYGCLQIWRHITYAHYDKRNIDRLYEYWVKEGASISAKTYIKKFNFPVIRKLAIKRYQKLDWLIKEIKKETQGRDIAD